MRTGGKKKKGNIVLVLGLQVFASGADFSLVREMQTGGN